MGTIRMTLMDLLEISQAHGYGLADANLRPIAGDWFSASTGEELICEQAEVTFRLTRAPDPPGVLADVKVRQQLFHLTGDPSKLKDLRTVLSEAARMDPRSHDRA
jgi:hypothetical protein